MIRWEKDLRKRLEQALPDATYILGRPPYTWLGSKEDKINYEVAVERNLRKAAAQFMRLTQHIRPVEKKETP